MSSSSSENDVLLNQLADEFVQRYRQGERPSLSEYVERYPDLASDIREVLPALVEMEQVEIDPGSIDPVSPDCNVLPEQIGDFRVLSRIGQGGMGVVYEAEQLSLGRHVALKVIEEQKLARNKLINRFRREAKAVARLHHTNIVPIFFVGEEEGLPYYAMQLIRGLGLDQVLEEIQCRGEQNASSLSPLPGRQQQSSNENVSVVELAHSLMTGEFRKVVSNDSDDSGSDPEVYATTDTFGGDRKSTSSVQNDSHPDAQALSASALFSNQTDARSNADQRIYWKTVSSLGEQAAGGLAYAHRQGVLHRDIKPSNLLLDMGGTVWITDFGLAKVTDEQDLTGREDILGTLRYMPPEAFKQESDERSDVYALGLTLYELLALRPAFDANEHAELFRQVTTDEPVRLRKLNRQIPRDLETIVHKAIEREPDRRYQSAEEMAEDLRRFLADEPIQARRPSTLERVSRWARRNKAVATWMAMALLFLIGGMAASITLAIKAELLRQQAVANGEKARIRAARELTARLKTQVLLYANQLTRSSGHSRSGWHFLSNEVLDQCLTTERGWEWDYVRNGNCAAKPITTLKTEVGPVHSACFSPDDATIATAGQDGLVRLWDSETGEQLHTFTGHEKAVTCVAFSPCGTRVASAGDDTTVRIWDVLTGDCLHVLTGHTGRARDIAYSPEGNRLASASNDHTVRVWDTHSGALLLHFKGHGPYGVKTWLSRVSFDPTGSWVLSTGRDRHGAARVWSSSSGVERLCIDPPGDLYGYCGDFAPDGKTIATGHDKSIIYVWDASNGRLRQTLRGHKDVVVDLCYSPDGTRLASASMDRTVKLWDLSTGRLLLSLPEDTETVQCVRFSSDGTRLITTGGTSLQEDQWIGGRVRIWDVRTHSNVLVCRGHTRPVTDVAVHPNNRYVASASEDGTVKLWDSRIGEPIRTFREHLEGVQAVRFSPRTGHLASADRRGVVIVRNVNNGKQVVNLKTHDGKPVYCLAFSSDGSMLATASQDATVCIWETSTGRHLFSLRGHQGTVYGVSFDPSGGRLATAAADKTVRLWDVKTGMELMSLRGHKAIVRGVAFSPDGQRLASASDDNSIRIWDCTSGTSLLTLKGHKSRATGVCFSPDGARLLSSGGGTDSTTGRSHSELKIWNARHGLELLSLQGHQGWVTRCCCTPDGGRIVSAGADSTVRIWSNRRPGIASPTEELWKTVAWHYQRAYSAEGSRHRSAAVFHLRQVPEAQIGLCRICLESGDVAGYRAHCRTLDAICECLPQSDFQPAALWSCVLGPGALPDFSTALASAQSGSLHARSLHAHRTFAGLLLRAGKPRQAIQALEQAIAQRKGKGAAEELLLGLAFLQVGNKEKAKDALQTANAWLDRPRPPQTRPSDGLRWGDLRLLRRELTTGLGAFGIAGTKPAQMEIEAIAELGRLGATFDRDHRNHVVGIRLAYSRINDDQMQYLTKLPHLGRVELITCENVAGAGLQYLEELKHLKALSIQGRVGDAVLLRLGKLANLERLRITCAAVTNAGIRSLYPGATRITNKGAQSLSNLSLLKDLSLEGTSGAYLDLTDDAFLHLTKLKGLSRLQIINAIHLTDAGLVRLKSLPQLERLSVRCRSNKRITDKASIHLQELKELESLDLSGSAITDTTLLRLQQLPHLQTLELASCSGISDRGIGHLQKLLRLEKLDLGRTPVTDQGIVQLETLKDLQELRLASTHVSTKALESLRHFPNLQLLDLGGTRMTVRGLEHLAALRELRSLNLSGCELPDVALVYVAKLPKLQELQFRNNAITDKGLQHLAGMTNLVTLFLSAHDRDGSNVTDDGLVHLKKLTRLEHLSLPSKHITDAGLAHLAHLVKLKSLALYFLFAPGCISDSGLAHLKNLKALEQLVVRYQKVTGAGLHQVANHPKLRNLNLGYNRMRPDGGFSHLRDCRQLRHLGLQTTYVTDAGLRRLEHHPGLSSLNLPWLEGITDNGLEYLHSLPSLRRVGLGETGVTPAGINRLRLSYSDPPFHPRYE